MQFGNWISQSQRQELINNTYDALMDLSRVLEIQPQALSLNGELALSFGARGKDGTNAQCAHYEQEHTIINLTKQKGAGNLAYAWFHAFDHHVSKLAHKDLQNLNLASDNIVQLTEQNPNNKLIQSLSKLNTAITQTDLPKRSQNIELNKSNSAKKHWSKVSELTARSFETYVKNALSDKDKCNDFLVNFVGENDFAKSANLYPYPTKSELPTIKAAFNDLVNNLDVYMQNNQIILGEIIPTDLVLNEKASPELSPSNSEQELTPHQILQQQKMKSVYELMEKGFAEITKTSKVEIRATATKPTQPQETITQEKEVLPKNNDADIWLIIEQKSKQLEERMRLAGIKLPHELEQEKQQSQESQLFTNSDNSELKNTTQEQVNIERPKSTIITNEQVRELWLKREKELGLTAQINTKKQEKNHELQR